MNPISIYMKTVHMGFINPIQSIQEWQKYSLNCKTASDQLCAYLNVKDYQKVEKLIDSIIKASGEFNQISQSHIEQYSKLKDLENRRVAKDTIKEEKNSGSFTKEELEKCKKIIEISENISYSDIETELSKLADRVVKLYEDKYISLLKLKGSTFETIYNEIQENAEKILFY